MQRTSLPRFLGTLLLVIWAGASPADEAVLDEFPVAALRGHMEFLSDDLLEGRAAGSRGYNIAAAYVATTFGRLGLEPAGGDGSFFQHYQLIESTLKPGTGEVAINRDGASKPLAFERDFMMGGSYLNERAEVTAPVSFVGFGITASELDHDDYRDVDVSGRIVAMFGGAPESFPPNQRAYYSSTREKMRNAVARGAVGVLYVYTSDFLERNPWDRVVSSYAFPGMRWVAQDGTVQGSFPEIRAAALLSPSGFASLLDGTGRTPAEVESQAQANEVGELEVPGTVTIRRESIHRSLTDKNVAALLPGSDATLASEVVVITGHLDHIGIGPEVDGDTIYNGYYDNTAGIAIMLEVARVLATSPQRPARSILFLAVGAEEKGLLGSDYFAQSPSIGDRSLVANVNLDMPLFIYPLADVVAYGSQHSSLEAPTAAAAEAVGLTLAPDPMPEEVIFVRSDQYSLVRRGVPAVYLSAGFTSSDPDIDGAAAFRAFLSTTYHQPGDASGLAFDDLSARRFTAMNYLLVRAIADAPAAPTWNEGDFFGEKFGAGQHPSE